jgi:5'-nucleotidase
VAKLEFDPDMTVRGLVLDTELGNVVKTNRFGYVKRAFHGTQPIAWEQQRDIYSRVVIDLASERFVFVNTLFSKSEVCMYSQLVDLIDRRALPDVLGYADLYREVKRSLDEAHMEGALKAEIVADPDRFVELDEETPLALLDQERAGKKLLLITNSEWSYTKEIMVYAFDRFLPDGMSWRDLFDVIIVSARKPEFFTGRSPLFEVVDEQGLLRPVVGGLKDGGIYLGGNAQLVEERLGLSADQILYVGDHLFSDVHVSKNVLRWRTALILRELEEELDALMGFAGDRQTLAEMMVQKEKLELEHCQLRLALQRKELGYGPDLSAGQDAAALKTKLASTKEKIETIDAKVAPFARAATEVSNKHWGLIMRAGNDKSLFARQVERSADIYLSRVSNFMRLTPFAYLRSPHGSLPHDPGPGRL